MFEYTYFKRDYIIMIFLSLIYASLSLCEIIMIITDILCFLFYDKSF